MESKIDITEGALFDGRYRLIKKLSSDGATADVWLAIDWETVDKVFDEELDDFVEKEDSGIKVALKIYRPRNEMDIEGEKRFRDEFKIVFNCHHANLVQPINFSIFKKTPYLVLPFCQNGSSETLQGNIKDPQQLWNFLSDVSSGLHYLHSFSPTIIHNDIKPANILIDDNGNFAITDFGISSHRGRNHQDSYYYTNSGTMAYMAPERFIEGSDTLPESDIWSLGATLYELVTGSVPFGDSGGRNQYETKDPVPKIEANIPSDLKRLIYDCLNVAPSKRPSITTIQKAAQLQKYPLPKSWLPWTIGAAIVILVLFILSILPSPNPEPPIKSIEQQFQAAMLLLNDMERDSLAKGMALMENLSKTDYVPAIYQLAYTYGWYGDSASLARKFLLDIPFEEENEETLYLPIDYQINNKAVGLLTRIEELNDSNYAKINAEALYRLACYYGNTDYVVKLNPQRTRQLLDKALYWAQICKDRDLLRKINNGLESFNNQ